MYALSSTPKFLSVIPTILSLEQSYRGTNNASYRDARENLELFVALANKAAVPIVVTVDMAAVPEVTTPKSISASAAGMNATPVNPTRHLMRNYYCSMNAPRSRRSRIDS